MRITILWIILISPVSLGTSFDCKLNNLNKAEKLTCENSELSKLDDIVSALYSEVQSPNLNRQFYTGEAKNLRLDQINWIKEKNNCKDVICLSESYQNRIHDLSLLIKEHAYYKSEKYILNILSNDFDFSISDFDGMDVELLLHYRLPDKGSTYLVHVHGSRNRPGFCGGAGVNFIAYFVVDENSGKVKDKKSLATDECHGEYVLYTEAYYNSYESKIIVGYQAGESKIPAFQIETNHDGHIEFIRLNNPPLIMHREKEQQY